MPPGDTSRRLGAIIDHINELEDVAIQGIELDHDAERGSPIAAKAEIRIRYEAPKRTIDTDTEDT